MKEDTRVSLVLFDYSERSVALFGEETKNMINQLKEIGGKFNPHLTHPETKEKCAGWVFSKNKKDKVMDVCSKNKKDKVITV